MNELATIVETPTEAPREPEPREPDPLDTGLKFVHAQVSQVRRDMVDQGSRILALTEELIARGLLDLRSLDDRRDYLNQLEAQRLDKQPAVIRIATDEDKYQMKDLPQIPCGELMHLCRGRCCKLTFHLSRQDLDEGVVKWDYGAPYRIQRRADGYCSHSAPDTHGCTVYQHRPTVCRRYDCRNDKRIWLDYEQRIPAPDDTLVQIRVGGKPVT
jgi:Fe-S-cluster containining protein